VNDIPPNQPTGVTLTDEVFTTPVAYILLDATYLVIGINQKAADADFRVGDRLTDCLEEDAKSSFLQLADASGKGTFESSYNQKGRLEFHVSPTAEATRTQLWAFDLSELRLIQSQLQQLKKPERKFLHQMGNLVSSTIGYVELVELMLDESTVLSGERLVAIKRYQGEIGTSLRKTENIIQNEKRGAMPYSGNFGSSTQHVLVVHPDPTRVELLAELLRSQQYKVTTFSDTEAATKFARLNGEFLNLAILSESNKLADYLLKASDTLQLLICASEKPEIENSRVSTITDKPLDMNEFLSKVQEIRSEANGPEH